MKNDCTCTCQNPVIKIIAICTFLTSRANTGLPQPFNLVEHKISVIYQKQSSGYRDIGFNLSLHNIVYELGQYIKVKLLLVFKPHAASENHTIYTVCDITAGLGPFSDHFWVMADQSHK